jgi:hypothetical protein
MVVALIMGEKRACLLAEGVMKKGFLNAGLSVMLVASFCGGAVAQLSPASTEEKQKKERVQIVVVEKKEREKSGGGESRRPRPGDGKGK